MLRDWMKGRRSEVDDLNGQIVIRARGTNVATPVNAAVVELARRIEQGALKPGSANLELLEQMIRG
jgi:2-dehydropantoate 2-reductase